MNLLKRFFYLSKNDRQALFALIAAMAICLAIAITVGNGSTSTQEISQEETFSDKDSALHSHPESIRYYKEEGDVHELFTFDPNTADSTELLRLGLAPWQVRNIYHYRAKGGVYSKPSDFAKVYGLSKGKYELLLPYIKIADRFKPASDFYGREYRHGDNTPKPRSSYKESDQDMGNTHAPNQKIYSYPQKIRTGEQISINKADTTELKKVPGIGSYYAKAIIRYREQLGGFVSPNQLREIEDFPESAIGFFKIETDNIKRLNLNKLSTNQLKRHPYLNFYQAKAINDYCRQNGPLKSLEELSLLPNFPPAEIERLKPYVCF